MQIRSNGNSKLLAGVAVCLSRITSLENERWIFLYTVHCYMLADERCCFISWYRHLFLYYVILLLMWNKVVIRSLVVLHRWWEVVPRQWGRGPVWAALPWRGHHGLRHHVSAWLQHWWRRWTCLYCSHVFQSAFTRAASDLLSYWVLSDEIDDWDFDGVAKPFEVHNDSYANNEDEDEDEGEGLEGRKVMVRSFHSVKIRIISLRFDRKMGNRCSSLLKQ